MIARLENTDSGWPELRVDDEVSLAAPTARHVRSLTTEQAAAPELELGVGPPSEVTIPLPNLSAWPRARDEAKILLESAAEVEHPLMVQYLYAAYSLKNKREVSDPAQNRALDDTSDRSWPHTLWPLPARRWVT